MAEPRGHQPEPSKPLADVAASEVETILAAAQQAAEQLRQETLAELDRARDAAERNAEAIGEQARARGQDELADAQARAEGIERDARREAEKVVADATAACEEVLADARALSYGLTRLGKLLEEHAATILRDVEAGHRRLLADLRIAGQGGSRERDPGADTGRGPRRRTRDETAPAGGGELSPFADMEVPTWLSGR